MRLYTKDDTQFTDDGILLNGKYFNGYTGVTKLCYYGEESLFDTIAKRKSPEEAKQILKKSSERGNRIHSQLENDYASVIKKKDRAIIGSELAHEVFLHGNIFNVDVLGYADAIFKNENTYTIVDYKTKSSKFVWSKYGDLTKYWMQLAAYAILFNKMYGITDIQLAIYVIFVDTMKYQPYYLSIKDSKKYAIMLNKKASLMV